MGWPLYLDGLDKIPGWVGHYTWMGWPLYLDGYNQNTWVLGWVGHYMYLDGRDKIPGWVGQSLCTPGWVGHYTWMGITKIPGSLDGLALFVPWQELDGNLLPDFCLISVTGRVQAGAKYGLTKDDILDRLCISFIFGNKNIC